MVADLSKILMTVLNIKSLNEVIKSRCRGLITLNVVCIWNSIASVFELSLNLACGLTFCTFPRKNFAAPIYNKVNCLFIYHIVRYLILNFLNLENLPFSRGRCFSRGTLDTSYYLLPPNYWTTGDKELKFYMVIDIHKLFWKVE